MKESFSRSKTKKNSQSSEFAFGASITKEKLTNPLKTLSDLCTNTTSTFRDHSSHRVLKPFSTLSPFPLDMKSLSPTFRKSQGGKRAFSHSLVGGMETNTVLNLQKVEENENQNIQSILMKARKVVLEENEAEKEVSELKALEKSLEVKDMIIEIYQQLIKVCTNKKMSLLPLKKNVTSNREGSSKQGLQNKGNKHYTGLRKTFMIDSPGISSSFNTVQKSTNPTLSRISHFSPEKNDSPYTSKFTDQESISYKEEVSASSPRLKSSIQSSPLQFPQKPLGKIDNRIKTLESIYKFGIKHYKKESLSPLKSSSILPAQIISELSPFKEKTPYKSIFFLC